jgi:hypothetical protein
VRSTTAHDNRDSGQTLNDRDLSQTLKPVDQVQVDPPLDGVQGQPEPEPQRKEQTNKHYLYAADKTCVSCSHGRVMRPTLYPELVHPAIDAQLYPLYVQALGQSTLQTQANQVARQMNIDVQALALEITQSCKISSPSYQESVPKTHTWCYPHTSVWCHPLLVQTNGCVSSLASSGVRTEHQQQQACLTTPSCTTARTVLVRERSRAARPRLDQLLYCNLVGSLSSRRLLTIQRAIEGPGLWKYIQSEFIRNGKGDDVHKP